MSVELVHAMHRDGPHLHVPLSSEQPEFYHQWYWRLPINTEIILAMLINQSTNHAVDWEEIDLIQMIYECLLLRRVVHLEASRGHHDRGGGGARKSRTLEKGKPQMQEDLYGNVPGS